MCHWAKHASALFSHCYGSRCVIYFRGTVLIKIKIQKRWKKSSEHWKNGSATKTETTSIGYRNRNYYHCRYWFGLHDLLFLLPIKQGSYTIQTMSCPITKFRLTRQQKEFYSKTVWKKLFLKATELFNIVQDWQGHKAKKDRIIRLRSSTNTTMSIRAAADTSLILGETRNRSRKTYSLTNVF